MFRPLSYFQKLEDETRRDEFEGRHLRDMTGAEMSVDWDNTGEYTHALRIENGKIVFDDHRADKIHVFCFSHQPQPKFGPSTIEIFRPIEFIDHYSEALGRANAKLEYGSIQYYDDAEKLFGLPDIRLWLFKRKQYKTEKEFRLSFVVQDRQEMYRRNFGGNSLDENSLITPYIKLRVGPLHDFARLV